MSELLTDCVCVVALRAGATASAGEEFLTEGQVVVPLDASEAGGGRRRWPRLRCCLSPNRVRDRVVAVQYVVSIGGYHAAGVGILCEIAVALVLIADRTALGICRRGQTETQDRTFRDFPLCSPGAKTTLF